MLSTRFVAVVALAFALAFGVAVTTTRSAAAANPFVVNKTGDASDRNIGNGVCDSSTKSGNQCTLRAAIEEANFTTAFDTINFNIAAAPRVIKPTSPLPPITQVVTINGYSQPGSSPNTTSSGDNAVLKITLDGVDAGASANGLELGGYKSTVRGLVIQRFGGSGVVLVDHGDKVYGSFIGTTADGTAARGNATGITITGTGGNVGSSAPADRNVISGNVSDGIHVSGPDADGAFIVGNYIGTQKSGTAGLGNGQYGVFVEEASQAQIGYTQPGYGNVISDNESYGVAVLQVAGDNLSKIQGNLIGTNAAGTTALGNQGGIFIQASTVTVGGTATGARNIISANQLYGVLIYHHVAGNVVQGNYIGTNAAGTDPLGNEDIGVIVQDSSYNLIGGSAAGAGNVISASTNAGVALVGGDNNTVQGNKIGTKFDGTGDLGNGEAGVDVLGSTENDIGGTGARGNVIANSGTNGVDLKLGSTDNQVVGNSIVGSSGNGVQDSSGANEITSNSIISNGVTGVIVTSTATGTTISANVMIGNAGLGINLDGGPENALRVTSNDLDDPDSGPNDLQNFPALTSATRSTGTGLTTVAGNLNSLASTQFRIELFIAVADSSGHGESLTMVAAQNVTTNSGGDKSFSFVVSGLTPGQQLTATATNNTAGSTSEFSGNISILVIP